MTDHELTPREQIEATVWRVLRAHTVTVLAPDIDPSDDETASAVLDPHTRLMTSTLALVMTCLDQGIASHLSELQAALHTRTGMDDDVIDDMMASVSGWSGGDGDPLDM